MLYNMNTMSNILDGVGFYSTHSRSLQTLPSSRKEGEKMPSGKDKNTAQRGGVSWEGMGK